LLRQNERNSSRRIAYPAKAGRNKKRYTHGEFTVGQTSGSIFGHGGLGGSFGFVDLENRTGYAYVMNHSTQPRQTPTRSVVMSNEIYRVLGVEMQ
jgi:CubicO group peptidase (beta-lactamase class C family)